MLTVHNSMNPRHQRRRIANIFPKTGSTLQRMTLETDPESAGFNTRNDRRAELILNDEGGGRLPE